MAEVTLRSRPMCYCPNQHRHVEPSVDCETCHNAVSVVYFDGEYTVICKEEVPADD